MSRRRITVVFVIDFLESSEGLRGGTERQLLEIIENLDPDRFRPILVCLREYGEMTEQHRSACEKFVLQISSLISFRSFLSLVRFVRFLRENRVDILQAFFFDSILVGVACGRLGGVRNIISCRRDMGFWLTGKLNGILSLSNLLTTRFLANSHAIKERMLQRERVWGRAIDVIYNGVDLRAIDKIEPLNLSQEFSEIGKGDYVVGLVGNYNRRVKRVDVFIRGAALVLKQRRNVKFLIIGGGSLEHELKDLSRELGIEEHIVFAGKRDEAIPYVKAFDIGVISSDSEGFSNVILEYMACGIPVVATDVGGNKELVVNGANGLLVPAGDHNALASAVLKLLSDEVLRTSMGRKGYRMIEEEFSWDRKIKEVEEYYIRLATSG